MKMKALPLMIAGLVAVSANSAVAEVKVYGKANVSVHHTEVDGGDSSTELKSNASRIGFKGSEKISDSLKAVYKFEYQTAIDDGDEGGKTFKQRNIYVGLKGDFGLVAAGKNDTPLKKAQGKIDQFNDLTLGDIGKVIQGDNREDNSVWYSSPKMAGVQATIATILEQEGDKTGISAAVNYKADGLYLALAVDQNVDSYDTTRLAAQYSMGAFGVGAIYQMAEKYEGTEEETGLVLSAFVKAGKNKFKAQIATAEVEDGSTTTKETTQLTLGVDHKLSKKAKVYGYYSMQEEDISDAEVSTLGVGVEVKF